MKTISTAWKTLPALLLGAGIALLPAGAALAQSVPDTITVVVPYTPGATADLNLRLIAREVTETSGRNVIVKNVPGAGAVLGAVEVVGARPDGGTLLLSIVGTHVTSELAASTPPYSLREDFVPVTRLWSAPLVLAVDADSPANSVAELLEQGRQKDGGLSYASPGVNSASHLVGIALAHESGVPMRHVAYQGAAPAIVDLVAGRVDIYFSSYTAIAPQVAQGQLKVLAVLDPSRQDLISDIPTMEEAGFAGINAGIEFALLAPAGTPSEAVEVLRKEFSAAANAANVQETLAASGDAVATGTPEELAAFIDAKFEEISAILASR